MCASFALKYPDFLPKSNFLRFIVKYGPQSTKYDDERDYLVWKKGMVFSDENSNKTVFAECDYKEDKKTISIQIEDNDPQLAKEIFDTLYEIDDCSGMQVSIKKEGENWIEWVEVEKLLKKQEKNITEVEGNITQIEGMKGETLKICDFEFLLPERFLGGIRKGKNEPPMEEPMIPTDIPFHLKKAIRDNKLILFVGSGMSIKFGFPNWKNLAIEICEYVEKKSWIPLLEDDDMTAIEVISRLEKKYKKEIVEKLENAYKKLPSNADLSLHKKLFDLSPSVITTNYDKAFEKANDEVYVVQYFDDYKLSRIKDKLNTKEPFVYKLHGCIDSPDNCVLFQSNYDKIYKTPNQNFSVFELQKMFSDYTFLFLGYSMNDTEINDLFGAVNLMQKGYASNHFIVSTSSFDDYEKLENYPPKLESYDDIEKVIDGLIAFKEGHSEKKGTAITKNEDVKKKINPSNPDIAIAKKIDDLSVKMEKQFKESTKERKAQFDSLSKGQTILKEGQAAILLQNDRLYLKLEIIESISESEQKNNQTELTEMQTLLNHLLSMFEQSTALVDKATKERNINEAVSVAGKLKLIVPIIPFLVNYETEITYTANEPVKSWKDIYRAFIGK